MEGEGSTVNIIEIINQHNEDMLNSINYAKKIQTAILPPLELIQKNIPQSFIFYNFIIGNKNF